MAIDLREVFSQVTTIINAEPGVSEQELAAKFGIDRHTLLKAIRLGSGKSFRNLRHEARLAKSIELTESRPDIQIKELAFLLGYQSSRSFCRFIKTITGCPLGQVRFRSSLHTNREMYGA